MLSAQWIFDQLAKKIFEQGLVDLVFGKWFCGG
jgi:hypothetical protein